MSEKTNGKRYETAGRPRVIEIDWDVFDKLCGLQCTCNELASFFGCGRDTITERLKKDKGMTYEEYFKTKSGHGKISLRRKQFEKAMSGNVAMLIWLGKQYLGQAERSMLGQGELDDENFRNKFFGISENEDPKSKDE